MKFKKKVVVVEAIQLTKDMVLERVPLPEGVKVGSVSWNPRTNDFAQYRCYLSTLDGKEEIRINDWIITGVTGAKFSCTPGIFKATYEKIVE